METKKSRHHNRCLDFSPICIRVASEKLQILLISVSHRRPQPFKLSCVALPSAGTAAQTGHDSWQRNAWDAAHFCVAGRDLYSQIHHSFPVLRSVYHCLHRRRQWYMREEDPCRLFTRNINICPAKAGQILIWSPCRQIGTPADSKRRKHMDM